MLSVCASFREIFRWVVAKKRETRKLGDHMPEISKNILAAIQQALTQEESAPPPPQGELIHILQAMPSAVAPTNLNPRRSIFASSTTPAREPDDLLTILLDTNMVQVGLLVAILFILLMQRGPLCVRGL